MYNYQILTEEFSRKTGYKFSDIYNFDLSPRGSDYESFFQFGQNDLNGNNLKLTETELVNFKLIEPLFFFKNDLHINAGAGRFKNYSLIVFNKGLMQLLHSTYFINNSPIDEIPAFNKYLMLDKLGLGSLEYFMYSLSCQFIFYHEKGHLYQKRNNDFWLNERSDNSNEKFNFDQHILEYDADIHAVSWICMLFYTYHQKLEIDALNSQSLIDIICLGTTAILIYFTRMHENFQFIHFKEKSHPHHVIRIYYIINAVIKIIEAQVIQPNFKLDREAIVLEVFNLAKSFKHDNGKSLSNFDPNNFIKVFIDNETKIDGYVKELQEEALSERMKFLNVHHIVKTL